MATQEENDRLTRVGPGTPMGNLLRRYWHPVGTEAELAKEPVQRVRWFGEDLTLFRSARGEYGLIDERCPHRCVSLEYGIPEECGLRCAYHGWLFDAQGRCLEQPFEELAHPDSRFKDEMKIKSYPVEALGGLVWGYFGPRAAAAAAALGRAACATISTAPSRSTCCRAIGSNAWTIRPTRCTSSSSMPGSGTTWRRNLGRPPAMNPARHVKIAFDVFKYGIYKRRLLEGEPETADDWTVGHPLLFPNTLAQGGAHAPNLQIRVPVDDTHTMQLVYRTMQRKPGAPPRPIAVKHTNVFDAEGKVVMNTILAQDALAWVGQGAISDRTREHLATSDRGIVLYHKLLNEQMERVERGLEPMALVRDRAENEPMIDLARERRPLDPFGSRYDNAFDKTQELADIR